MFEVAAARKSENSGKSLGAILAAARKSRDLPIEQTARDTRIRVQRLREIENDDFSHFSHPSYVRMFLMDYSRYLGIDIAEIENFLPDRGECGSAGYQYLQDFSREDVVPFMRKTAPKRRLMPVVLIVLAIVVGVLGGRLWMNIERLELDHVANVAPSVDEQAAEILKSDREILNELGKETAPALSQPVEDTAPADAEKGFTFSPISTEAPSLEPVLVLGGTADRPASLR